MPPVFPAHRQRVSPPHITLASFPAEQEAEVARHLRGTEEMAEAVPVVFTHLSVFSGGRVLFASPAANGRLFSLRQKFGTDEAWTPHATLLIDEPEEIICALALVSRHFSAFSGQVRALSLYEFFPARPILTAELGTASALF